MISERNLLRDKRGVYYIFFYEGFARLLGMIEKRIVFLVGFRLFFKIVRKLYSYFIL